MSFKSPTAGEVEALKAMAKRVRCSVIEMSHIAKTPHLGSSLSCTDIVVAAYSGALNISRSLVASDTRDRFILSKGHAATTLYSCLAFHGFFPEILLKEYAKDGGKFAEHPGPGCAPGIEAATGSLGHGLSLGLGMALASRIKGTPYRVVVVLSDGECNEGSVWEAALFAAAQKLDNLTIVIDFNGWQATGRSTEVMALSPLVEKWRAFGWESTEIDGHDIGHVATLLSSPPNDTGQPRALIAKTVKGKGVSFMEDDNNWHYRIPTAEEVSKAYAEINRE